MMLTSYVVYSFSLKHLLSTRVITLATSQFFLVTNLLHFLHTPPPPSTPAVTHTIAVTMPVSEPAFTHSMIKLPRPKPLALCSCYLCGFSLTFAKVRTTEADQYAL